MNEKPIIFSTDMVRAILDERKSQTRRVIKPQPKLYRDREWTYSKKGFHSHYSAMLAGDKTFFGWLKDTDLNSLSMKQAFYYHNPYGVPGDLLYVRETFAQMCKGADPICWCDEEMEKEYHYIEYKADTNNEYPGDWDVADKEEIEMGKEEGWLPRWKPSIHMPKKFARIWLEVKDVRVERVQEISEQDAKAEGVIKEFEIDLGRFTNTDTDFSKISTYKIGFEHLWDDINKSRGYPWENNDWVWAVEFERIET